MLSTRKMVVGVAENALEIADEALTVAYVRREELLLKHADLLVERKETMKAGKSTLAIAIKLSDSEDEIVEIHTKIKEVEKYSEMLRHNLDELVVNHG